VKNSDNPHIRLQHTLDQRRLEHRYRSLNEIDSVESSRIVTVDGKKYLNFSSNDYLNLAHHPGVIDRSRKYLEKYGSSSSSSRLITGSMKFHNNVECKLASIYNKDGALLFATGFQANSTILPAITEKKDVIIADQLCHNSILTGCLASKAGFYRFRHNDLDHLETFLKRKSRNNSENIWVVTESLFSMDGDLSPLDGLSALCREHDVPLMVDDAHGIGVLGQVGAGVVETHELSQTQVPVLVGTLGKALGVSGAFVAGSRVLIDYLIQKARTYIYTTAMPPALAAATLKSLSICREESWRRERLARLVAWFRDEAGALGYQLMASWTPIQPVVVGSSESAMALSSALGRRGILVPAIRPPTVPSGSARLRFTFSASHTDAHMEQLLEGMAAARSETGLL